MSLVTILVYSVSITAFVLMALTIAIDARSALEGMGAFLGGFLVVRLLSAPPLVQFLVPLVAGAGVFIHRFGIVRDGLPEGMMGRSIGKLMVGMLSAASLVAGLFLSVLFYRSGAFDQVISASGTARTVLVLLLELGPVVVGVMGLGLLYWSSR